MHSLSFESTPFQGGIVCTTRRGALDVSGQAVGPSKLRAERAPPKPKSQSHLIEDKRPVLSKKAAKELIGRSIEVYWDGEEEWYVIEYNRYIV